MPSMTPELTADFVSEVLEREGAAWVRAASPSMAPLIQPEDQVCLVPAEPAGVRRGTVIAYRDGDRIIVHRVLATDPRGVVTKGDALADADGVVGWDRVVGRVVTIRTPRGRVVRLDVFPRPLIDRALGALAGLAPRNVLVWGAHRGLFRLLALLTR